jgi:hypothetical protein
MLNLIEKNSFKVMIEFLTYDFFENIDQIPHNLDVSWISNKHMPLKSDRDQLKVVEPHLIDRLLTLMRLFHL